MKLYSYSLSGNSWKTRLMLGFLDLDYELIETTTSAKNGEKAGVLQPEFLKLNPKAQVPVLVDLDAVITDSAAICIYLAKKYDSSKKWFPEDPFTASQIIYWVSTSANEINNSLAKARRRELYNDQRFNLHECQQKGYEVLDLIESQLQKSHWLVTQNCPTVADLVCYPYLKLCPQGGLSLEHYPKIQAWLNRFETLKGYLYLEDFGPK